MAAQSPRRAPPRVVTIGLVAASYVLTGALGLIAAVPPDTVTAVWLPSGIAISALLLAGRGAWPGIAIGALLTNLVLAPLDIAPWSSAVVVAVITAVGSTLQTLAGAAAIERFAGGRDALDTPRRVAVLFAIVLSVCVLGATVGVGVRFAMGLVPVASLPDTWSTWWLGDVGGIVLVTPLVLAVAQPVRSPLRRGDVVLLAVAGLGLAQLILGWPLHGDGVTISSYLALPLVVLAAVRVGTRGVGFAVLGVYALMLWATARGHGPFSTASVHAQLLQLDGYLVAIAATGLVVAASVRERDAVSRALRDVHAELEALVGARTARLVQANDALTAEIGERQRVERELRESEARLRTAIESLPFDFWVCDASGRYVLQNSASIRHWGDQRGKVPEELGLPPETLADWQRSNARALAGEVVRRRTSYRHDGVDGTYDKLLAPIRLDDKIVGFLGVNLDITERERLAEELVRAQRLEATGRLAGGIAHDFNNLLTVVIATATMIERRDGEPRTIHGAQLILQAAYRAAELTRQLLAFAGKQRGSPVVRRIDVLVDEVRGLLRPILPSSIELRVEHAQPDATISIDPTQFGQVLVNLAMNARDAMPAGGVLTVRSAVTSLDDDAAAALRVPPGAFVRLEVQDTGTGIAPEVLVRVFEPFFTTKAVGEGTGLGLASVHGITTQAGGAVQVHSVLGGGTTVTVHLPRASGAPTAREVPPGAGKVGHGETILVVEDQPMVRDVIATELTEAGYRVVVAGDGEDALQVLGRHGGTIDLVLTDLVMPRMGGARLGHQLRSRGLDMPIIFMSGYADSSEALPVGPRLAKPFAAGDLATAVHDALAARPVAPATG